MPFSFTPKTSDRTSENRDTLLRMYLEGGTKKAAIDTFLVRREIDAIKGLLTIRRDLEAVGNVSPIWLIFSNDESQRKQSALLLDYDGDTLSIEGLTGKIQGLLMKSVRRRAISTRDMRKELLAMP